MHDHSRSKDLLGVEIFCNSDNEFWIWLISESDDENCRRENSWMVLNDDKPLSEV